MRKRFESNESESIVIIGCISFNIAEPSPPGLNIRVLSLNCFTPPYISIKVKSLTKAVASTSGAIAATIARIISTSIKSSARLIPLVKCFATSTIPPNSLEAVKVLVKTMAIFSVILPQFHHLLQIVHLR